jgi:NAD(P)-dependent dehydrogenase (short-subunit alcohol dehydrogenase family)
MADTRTSGGTARTVVVTGGGAGIGAAITRAFHANGDHVVVASRRDHGLSGELGDRVRFAECDVRSPASIARMMDATLGWTGRIDGLVNNAGFSGWRPLAEIDETFWTEMIDTNLKSVLFASQAAVERFGTGGFIVNISSLAGKRGSANNAVYCASKFGVNALTQALAKELGVKNVRVNAVCPVYVQTDGLGDALADPRSPAGKQEVATYLREFARTQSALGVLPEAGQVAAVCVFLASPAAGAITGQCLNVDCGVMPQ